MKKNNSKTVKTNTGLRPVERVVSPTFEDGVIYACARLCDLYDEPTMAFAILHESGIKIKNTRGYDEKILYKAGLKKYKE